MCSVERIRGGRSGNESGRGRYFGCLLMVKEGVVLLATSLAGVFMTVREIIDAKSLVSN